MTKETICDECGRTWPLSAYFCASCGQEVRVRYVVPVAGGDVRVVAAPSRPSQPRAVRTRAAVEALGAWTGAVAVIVGGIWLFSAGSGTANSVPDHVVIADNLRAHHTAGARAAIEARGARLLFLPPLLAGLHQPG